ncbi:MAG: EamA family transporter, partial [Candidatus Aenigmarchaeota archaeon]|nr:EamA family transporter [Candidatus Aenigmarchaeota archaeon]
MKLSPHLEVIIAATIWSTHGIFVKSLDLAPTTISFFRVAIPTLILLIYFRSKKSKLIYVDNKALMLFASFLFAIKTLLTVLGFQLAPISTVILVAYTWPIFAAIFGRVILKERLAIRNIYLLLMA